jgi:methyltransferase (TIGR00027 family)
MPPHCPGSPLWRGPSRPTCHSALWPGGRRSSFWRGVRRPNGYDRRHAQHPAAERSSACCSAGADGLPRLLLFMRPDLNQAHRDGQFVLRWPPDVILGSVSDLWLAAAEASERFAAQALDYDRYRPRYPDDVFDDLAELAGLSFGDTLVEIGAGTGIATEPLVERGLDVTAMPLTGLGRVSQAARRPACLPFASPPDVPFCTEVRVATPVVLALRNVPPRRRSTPIREALTSPASLRPCGLPRTLCAPGKPIRRPYRSRKYPAPGTARPGLDLLPDPVAVQAVESRAMIQVMDGVKRSRTAQGVAAERALLASKGVIDDPFAREMLTPSMGAVVWVVEHGPRQIWTRSVTLAGLAARVRWFDSQVVSALHDGVKQVVVIGAGYDSRPWRILNDTVRFFELDHPATQQDKVRRAPQPSPVYVESDLTTEDAAKSLLDNGLDSSQPTVFILEGVTMYFGEDVVRRQLESLRRMCTIGSRLAVDFYPPSNSGSAQHQRQMLVQKFARSGSGESLRLALDRPQAVGLVQESGWDIDEVTSLRDAALTLVPRESGLPTDTVNGHKTLIAAHVAMGTGHPLPD